MDTVNKIIVNALTNETVVIPLIDAELKALEKQAIEEENVRLALQAEAKAKAQAKAAAEGKLAALGLTTDDLRALGL